MDQVKEILRQAVKYRFWIAVGISLLLPLIGYFASAGTLKQKTDQKTAEITGAEGEVKKYTSGTLVNAQYKPLTDARVTDITKDVDTTWRRLYATQAPLLDWPSEVEERFKEWGRKYPEGVSGNLITATTTIYVDTYPEYAKKVYETFKPWNPEDGSGIVVAPPMDSLLQTAGNFNANNLPSLGKVWEMQENLWVRRAVLDVVAKVNERAKAKDWESAPLKEIQVLMVGNQMAVDHATRAKGVALKSDPDLTPPGQAAAPAPAADASAGDAGGRRDGGDQMGGQGGQAGSMMGSGGMMGTQASAKVEYIDKPGITQYRVYPILIKVLIDQNRLQDLLVEFQNSPMSMQVMEVNIRRPAQRVKPPVKGMQLAGMMGSMGSGGMMGGMAMEGGGLFGMMSGQGMGMAMEGGNDGYAAMMQGMSMMGRGQGMAMEGGMMGGQGGSGLGSSLGPNVAAKKRVDPKAAKKEEAEKPEEEKAETKIEIFDPYYNIIEAEIFAQARFYNQPPPLPAEATPAASPGDETTPPADGTTPAAESPKADEATAPVEETPKADAPAPAPDAPKADAPAPAPDTPAPAPDAPKADVPPGADVPPAEAAKPATPPGDAPTGDSPKS
jgi:hypothetical protein